MDGIREKGEAERAEGEGSKICTRRKKKVAKITTVRAKRDLLFKIIYKNRRSCSKSAILDLCINSREFITKTKSKTKTLIG